MVICLLIESVLIFFFNFLIPGTINGNSLGVLFLRPAADGALPRSSHHLSVLQRKMCRCMAFFFGHHIPRGQVRSR